MPDDRYRWSRALFALISVAALVLVVVLTEGPFVKVDSLGAIVILGVLWAAPAVTYWLFVRTAVASLAVGVGLSVGEPVAARAVILTDSSTAGLGFLAFGALWWIVVGGAIALSRAAATASR